jgi:hypothetical protein
MTCGKIPISEPEQIHQDSDRKCHAVQVSDRYLGFSLGEDWPTLGR